MSEDFDKEAEREKLRKRFEQEQEDREAAQRMSDLLLKGATMTNKHCGECGDPVFRQNGQEFCPTCQSQGGQAERAARTDEADSGTDSPDTAAPNHADDDATAGADGSSVEMAPTRESRTGRQGPNQPATDRPEAAQEPNQPATDRSEPTQEPNQAATDHSGGRVREHPTGDDGRAGDRPDDDGRAKGRLNDRRRTGRESSAPADERTRTSTRASVSGNAERSVAGETDVPTRGTVGAARAELAAAIETHARRATDTRDPAAAAAHLEAAREAAEALSALDRSE